MSMGSPKITAGSLHLIRFVRWIAVRPSGYTLTRSTDSRCGLGNKAPNFLHILLAPILIFCGSLQCLGLVIMPSLLSINLLSPNSMVATSKALLSFTVVSRTARNCETDVTREKLQEKTKTVCGISMSRLSFRRT